jgi:hypothetical protein
VNAETGLCKLPRGLAACEPAADNVDVEGHAAFG